MQLIVSAIALAALSTTVYADTSKPKDPRIVQQKKDCELAAQGERIGPERDEFIKNCMQPLGKPTPQRDRPGISIGMSADQVLASNWGKPKSVNTTITAKGKHEQWVYSGGQY